MVERRAGFSCRQPWTVAFNWCHTLRVQLPVPATRRTLMAKNRKMVCRDAILERAYTR